MAYILEELNGGYQLVWTRWYWFRNKKYDVHIDKSNPCRLKLKATYKKDTASSNYQTAAEASKLVRILDKLGVKKRALVGASFPEGTESRTIDKWAHAITWLYSGHFRN